MVEAGKIFLVQIIALAVGCMQKEVGENLLKYRGR